jgi:hypothetical protein
MVALYCVWLLFHPIHPVVIMDMVYTESQYDRKKKKYADFYQLNNK